MHQIDRNSLALLPLLLLMLLLVMVSVRSDYVCRGSIGQLTTMLEIYLVFFLSFHIEDQQMEISKTLLNKLLKNIGTLVVGV